MKKLASILLKTALKAVESEGFPIWQSTSSVISVCQGNEDPV